MITDLLISFVVLFLLSLSPFCLLDFRGILAMYQFKIELSLYNLMTLEINFVSKSMLIGIIQSQLLCDAGTF